jgi:hypothetical protein
MPSTSNRRLIVCELTDPSRQTRVLTALKVLDPAPNSGALVLPMMSAPRFSSSSTKSWDSVATSSRYNKDLPGSCGQD